MTKQEELFYILQDVRLGNLSEYEATLKLKELGVVLKVDRELPEIGWLGGEEVTNQEKTERVINDMLKAGYVAVKPVIKE